VTCGTGFTTTATAKISFADCYIPQGWGTTKDGAAYVAAECAQGTYGAAQDTYGVKSLPCTPCPAGMDTAEAGSNSPADCVTVAGWGYDQATGSAAKCTYGFYSAGGGRDECVSCGEGYTTAAEESDAQADCVIAPGYGYKSGGDPEPCAKGFYGVGGDQVVCAACSGQTMTTLDSLATSQADCDVCVTGFGGASCGVCAPNSYNQGDEKECKACAAGFVAPAGSVSADACILDWTALPPSVDTIAVATGESAYVTNPDVATPSLCKAACGSSCMFFTFDTTHTECYLASAVAGGADSIAFKSATSAYTVWPWTSSLDVATNLGAAAAAADLTACTARCDASDECVAVVFTAATSSCQLKQGATSPDFKVSEYRAVGANMPAASVAAA
jgi:hypothetical protein